MLTLEALEDRTQWLLSDLLTSISFHLEETKHNYIKIVQYKIINIS